MGLLAIIFVTNKSQMLLAYAKTHQLKEEARLFGATNLVQPVLLWPFLALPILLLVHFGVDLFSANFT